MTMNDSEIKLSVLKQAFSRLKEAAGLSLNQINRDASIQRFEFTFEITWKILKDVAFQKGIEVVSPKDSLRTAAELKLIENLDSWFDFLDARNLSSHTYNETTANLVYEQIKKFIPEEEALISKLESFSA